MIELKHSERTIVRRGFGYGFVVESESEAIVRGCFFSDHLLQTLLSDCVMYEGGPNSYRLVYLPGNLYKYSRDVSYAKRRDAGSRPRYVRRSSVHKASLNSQSANSNRTATFSCFETLYIVDRYKRNKLDIVYS